MLTGMTARRSVPLSESGHARAVAWWQRQPHLIGTIIVLLGLLAGLLPSWQLGVPLSADARPAAQSGKEGVIVELARGANPQAVARALGVVPTYIFTEVFQGFAAELPVGAVKATERQRDRKPPRAQHQRRQGLRGFEP